MRGTLRVSEELLTPLPRSSFEGVFQGGNSTAYYVTLSDQGHTKSRGLIFAVLRSLSGQAIYPSALGLHWFSLGQTLVLKIVIFVVMELLKRLHCYTKSGSFSPLCPEYPPFYHVEFICAFSGKSWTFFSLPLILCHTQFHKVEAFDFFSFFLSLFSCRANSGNLEPCLSYS